MNKISTPTADYLTGRTNIKPAAYTSLYMNGGTSSRFLTYQHPEFYTPWLTKSVGRGKNNQFLHKVQIHETPGQRLERSIDHDMPPPKKAVNTIVPEQFDEILPDDESKPLDVVKDVQDEELPAEATSIPVAEEATVGSADTISSALSAVADIDPANIPIEAAFGGLSLAANANASAQVPANTIAGKYDQMQTRNNAATMGADALLGATIGSALGPVGTLAGGLLGGAFGYGGPAKVPTTAGDQDVSEFTDI